MTNFSLWCPKRDQQLYIKVCRNNVITKRCKTKSCKYFQEVISDNPVYPFNDMGFADMVVEPNNNGQRIPPKVKGRTKKNNEVSRNKRTNIKRRKVEKG